MKKLTNLNELLAFQLEGMYDAEKQMQDHLPIISQGVQHQSVKEAINKYVERSVEKRTKLKRIFSYILVQKSKRKNKVVESLFNETRDLVHQASEAYLRDVIIAACLQSINHYSVANYRAFLAVALALNFEQVADLLDEILQFEKETSTSLEKITFEELQKKESII